MMPTSDEVTLSIPKSSYENPRMYCGNSSDEESYRNARDSEEIDITTISNCAGNRVSHINTEICKNSLSNNDERTICNSQRRPEQPEQSLDSHQISYAATFILAAKTGRNVDCIQTKKHVRLYYFYHCPWLRWILYVFIGLNLSLALFEKPSIPNASLPYWNTMLLEIACLCFFAFRTLHAMSFQNKRTFVRDPKNIGQFVVSALTIVDIVMYVIWINAAPDAHPVRWSRPLRPLFILNFPEGKQVRRAFRNIRRTVPDIMNILILFFLSVFLSALLALKLFGKRDLEYPNGDSYFTHYFDGLWDLYVLVTTANNPDVMMPAYDESNWFALYFIIFFVLCSYIFMSIVLATIYTNYKKNLENDIKRAVFAKRNRLLKAFHILKVEKNGKEVITHMRWRQLMNYLMPQKSFAYIDLMMKVLDDDNSNVLSQKNFMNLSDLLQVKLTEVRDRRTLLEVHFPKFYNHRYSENFKTIVRHRFFHYAFDLLILLNAIFIAVDLSKADWFFLSMFSIEILCKLYVLGGREYFLQKWNVFDFLIIGAAFIISIVEVAIGKGYALTSLDVILILRVLRLLKLFGSIERFNVILQTLMNIGPSILTYGGVVFVFYYFFAIIGMELFSGYIHYYGYNTTGLNTSLLYCGNVDLNGTAFYRLHYCNNNFNDILKAFVVMFELTVVNQWHVIASGFVFVTSRAARLYFFTFHLCCVVVVLNIFTAFILEAFILEFNLQTVSTLGSVVEAKIKEMGLGIGMKPKSKWIPGPSGDRIILSDDEVLPDGSTGRQGDTVDNEFVDMSKEKGFKFHLENKGQKNVEILLQQMFHEEINLVTEANNEDELQNIVIHRATVLDNLT